MIAANNCSTDELMRYNAMSSRIRLARNVRGLPFPRSGKSGSSDKMLELVKGAALAADGCFDAELYLMSRLNKAQKASYVERHIISLPLANNSETGAALVERGSESIAIMLNEEDHIREQCVVDGFDLRGAYRRLDAYDDRLISTLDIAFDEELGFLTACPTNLGTGMRASVMLFLPALRRAGAIEDALKQFKESYGLTVRGVYGEGSEAFGDAYQISNSRTLGIDEATIINQVEQAAVEMCYCERVALEKLVREKGSELADTVMRSWTMLTNAYSLSSSELIKLIIDAKMGVILGLIPIKETKSLDRIAILCSPSSLTLKIGECPPYKRDILRAELVRRILSEAK